MKKLFKNVRKEGKEKIKPNLNHLNILIVDGYSNASDAISVLHIVLLIDGIRKVETTSIQSVKYIS